MTLPDSIDLDAERDYAEEAYNANLCPACEHSPCAGGDGAGSCLDEEPAGPARPPYVNPDGSVCPGGGACTGDCLPAHLAAEAEADRARRAKATVEAYRREEYRAERQQGHYAEEVDR